MKCMICGTPITSSDDFETAEREQDFHQKCITSMINIAKEDPTSQDIPTENDIFNIFKQKSEIDSKFRELDKILQKNELNFRRFGNSVGAIDSKYRQLENLKAKMIAEKKSKRNLWECNISLRVNPDEFIEFLKPAKGLAIFSFIMGSVGFVCVFPSICVYFLTKRKYKF